ncbi:MAG: DUF3185 family protein [Planctomycetota bacterium]|nr:DUF3185 family protein [Planctomycetota bacterium]
MKIFRLLGILAVLAGLVLLFLGFQGPEWISDRIKGVVDKYKGDRSTLQIAGGTVAILAGLALAMFGGRGKQKEKK